MKAKHNLEHTVFNSWKKFAEIKDPRRTSGKVLVGVSGGRDSMVLLRSLIQCLPTADLVVVHCHHGDHSNIAYRNRAAEHVLDFCKSNGVAIEERKSTSDLNSEADFRAFRLESYRAVALKYGIAVVALGHHRDDWLENQLIKLIRGSGLPSLKKNFHWSWLEAQQFYIWRPLINTLRKDIEVYAIEVGITFVEDPSNSDSKYLRNWIRTQWLPMLEQKRPGSVNRLALSLIHSLNDIPLHENGFPWDFKTQSIDFNFFISLPDREKLRCLAFYVSTKGLKNIKSSQLKEIIKQIDTNGEVSHIHFKTFDCRVNAGQLFLDHK